MRFNRQKFFTRYRQEFDERLQQKQVDGLNFLLDKIEGDTFTLEQAAYVLATVKHETGNTFQPIKEKRARVGSKVRRQQDKYWGSGFYGRGFVQLTWKANYEKYGIADNPDAALEPEKAYEILSTGMRKGVFTGKKLTDYIIAGDVDYVQARRIVNGLDRATDIAEIADKFETILRVATGKAVEEPEKPTVTKPVTKEPETPTQPDKPPPAKPPPAQVDTTIPAIPPLVSHVPSWAKKIVGWGAGINILGLGSAFGFFRDNPQALAAALHIIKWTLLGVGVVAAIIVAGVFIAKLYYAKLANDLNVERLRHFSDPNSSNVDFSGWKGQGEVKS